MTSTNKIIIATITSLVLISSGVALSSKSVENDPAITAHQAIDIALGAVPGVIHEVELENDDDAMVWEVELVSSQDDKEYEILIDANTGEVLRQELDEDHGDWGFFSFKDNDHGDR